MLFFCLLIAVNYIGSIAFGNELVVRSETTLSVVAKINDYMSVSYKKSPVVFYTGNFNKYEDSVRMTVIRRGANYQAGNPKAFNLTMSAVLTNIEQTEVDVYFRNWNSNIPESKPYKEGVFEFDKEVQGFKTVLSSYDESASENLEMRIVLSDDKKLIDRADNPRAILNMLITAI